MSKEAMKLALEAAYLAGFNASGEGYNAEYPFNDHAKNPEEDAAWIKDRDNALQKALAEQPAQPATYTCGVCGVSMQMEQPAQQEIDWKDQYEKQKRRADMWVAKYEADIGPLEKAGPVTAQQEPVAWGIIASNTGRICQVELDADEIEGHNPKYIVPLYTSPPPCPTCEALARTVMLDQTSHDAQRQWVGLTEEEHTQIAINCGCMSADWVFYGAAVERNLKEKNT